MQVQKTTSHFMYFMDVGVTGHLKNCLIMIYRPSYVLVCVYACVCVCACSSDCFPVIYCELSVCLRILR